MAKIPLPDPDGLRQILSMMYGNGLEVREGKPVPAAKGSDSLVALYVDDDDKPVVACAVDYPFTAYGGASLTRVSPGVAKECAGNGDFSDIMIGNVHEILNICSRLLMKKNSPHLRLHTLYRQSGDVPDAVRELIQKAREGVDLNVSFPNYGEGGMSFRILTA